MLVFCSETGPEHVAIVISLHNDYRIQASRGPSQSNAPVPMQAS